MRDSDYGKCDVCNSDLEAEIFFQIQNMVNMEYLLAECVKQQGYYIVHIVVNVIVLMTHSMDHGFMRKGGSTNE